MTTAPNLPDYSNLSATELICLVSTKRVSERQATAELVLVLSELERRRLYLDYGHSSLYSFCCERLGLSAGAAMRRINSARVILQHPEVYYKLRDGDLCLSAVAEMYKILETENAAKVLECAQGKSRREVEKLIAQELPAVAPKKERIRPIKVAQPEAPVLKAALKDSQQPQRAQQQAYSISLQVDQEFMDLYQRIQLLAGERGMKAVLTKALTEYERRNCPKLRNEQRNQQRQVRREKRAAASKLWSAEQPEHCSQRYSQSVPIAVRDAVFVRDGGRCTFTAPDGVRCSCCTKLEVDHIVPRARGGSNDINNLRLTCRQHNQLYAEREFGVSFMARKRAA